MSEPVQFAMGFLGGLLMGLFFFGGLWLSVKRLPDSRNPLLVMFVSFLLRLAVLVLCFYTLARCGGWIAVLGAVPGLLLMRMTLVRRFGRKDVETPLPGRET